MTSGATPRKPPRFCGAEEVAAESTGDTTKTDGDGGDGAGSGAGSGAIVVFTCKIKRGLLW